MARESYVPAVYLTQAQVDAGAADAPLGATIVVVDGTSQPTGATYVKSGASSTSQVSSSGGGAAGFEKVTLTAAASTLSPSSQGKTRIFHLDGASVTLAALSTANWAIPAAGVDVLYIQNHTTSGKVFSVTTGAGQFQGLVTFDGDELTSGSFTIKKDTEVKVTIDEDGWVQIAATGSTYTKTELDTSLAAKQDTATLAHTTARNLYTQGVTWRPNATDTPGMQLWFRADELPTSGAVSAWNDVSGNSRNAAQATPANQPQIAAATLNGWPVVEFGTDTDDVLATAALPRLHVNEATVFAVFKNDTQGADVMFTQNESGTVRYFHVHPRWTDTNLYLDFGNASTSRMTVTSSPFVGAGFHIMTARRSGTTDGQVWHDGTSIHIDTSMGTPVNLTANQPFTIGAENAAGTVNNFEGEIAEIIAFNTALTPVQRQRVEGYLAWKYGLQADLAAGHPYKLAPPLDEQTYRQGHPFFTAATTAAHTVTHSTAFNPSYEGWKAFQQYPGNGDEWATATQPTGTVTLELPQPVAHTRVELRGRFGNIEYPDRWSIQGSNDGTAYTTVLDHTAADEPLNYNLGVKSYTLAPAQPYRFWRFNMTASEGSNPGLHLIRYYHQGIDIHGQTGTGGLLDGAVTNAKAADMAANSVKVNATAAAADPTDLAVGTNTVVGRVGANIVAAQVATAQIADDAVTYAKLQNISATDRLLGRSTAGAGAAEEITCTAAGRALIDDADAATQRTTLGVLPPLEESGFTLGGYGGTEGFTNFTVRQVLGSTVLSNAGGAYAVRLRLETHASTAVTAARIGLRAGSGDDYDFAAAPAVVTVGGLAAFTLAANTPTWTDWTTLDVPEGAGLVFAAHTSGGGWKRVAEAAGRGGWYKSGASDVATVDAIGYTDAAFTYGVLDVEFRRVRQHTHASSDLPGLSTALRSNPLRWEPSAGDLDGMLAWHRPDALTAGALATWPSEVPSGQALIQGTGANQPLVVTDQINGYPIVRFDGTNDFLEWTADYTNVRTVFLVTKEDSNAVQDGFLFGDNSVFHWHRDTTGGNIFNTVNAHVNVHTGTTHINGATVNHLTTQMPTQMSLMCVQTAGNVEIGNYSNDRGIAGRFWDGDTAEIIILSSTITAAQRERVEGYLAHKYALQDKLPATHPYRNYPPLRDYSRGHVLADTTALPTTATQGYVNVGDAYWTGQYFGTDKIWRRTVRGYFPNAGQNVQNVNGVAQTNLFGIGNNGTLVDYGGWIRRSNAQRHLLINFSDENSGHISTVYMTDGTPRLVNLYNVNTTEVAYNGEQFHGYVDFTNPDLD